MFNEDTIESAALDYFESLGYATRRGGDVATACRLPSK